MVFGMKTAHVIDNFLSNPEEERSRALAAEYKTVDHNGLSYPGISLVDAPEDLERNQKILGVEKPKATESFYRQYLPGQEQSTFIHSDVEIGTFSGVLFLNPPELCKGGLAFWRHRMTGLESHPSPEQCAQFGLIDGDPFFSEVHRQGLEERYWEMIDYVPMEFNRLVLFFSPRFHSRYPKDPIGENVETARLIKTYFYHL